MTTSTTRTRTATQVPQHLLIGPDTHGVTRYAAEVAGAAGALVARDARLLTDGGLAHLHVTDRLISPDPTAAAELVELLARRVRLTVTLHDVPQPTDGPRFRERTAAYERIVRASRAWATNSWHEHALIRRWCVADAHGAVIPLPIQGSVAPGPEVLGDTDAHVLGVFGFIYPGKGHRQVARAAAALRRGGLPVSVLVLGGAATGHAEEIDQLMSTSHDRGVPVEVAGRVPEDEVRGALRRVGVPVAAHRNISASGSVNSWIAAGRRPLVRDSAYAREMATLRPGTLTLFDDSTLVPRLQEAIRRPGSTWIEPGTDLGPRLEDTAAAYRSWWASVAG
ncbi:hypothetical protein [Nocardioides hwasunensis]|uniref:Glycosyltransferase n=1 Tax=Nocardioides hwasunensis TaxID=397258 RepID=A0ABR8MMF4_9ACTN|nr:hypothetical protein [Nocardioides hwasunensis]MBD3915990.1 hypothetical protein [Nocardioides hwasunensis]